MYNGIGLTTPKGSGTNGYVIRNMASITAGRLDFQKNTKSFKSAPDMKVLKANTDLLLHEQKRKVELDLMKLKDELKAAGMSEDEIERTIQRERGNMMEAIDEGSLRYDSELQKDTHQLALEKAKELEKFEKALRIDTSAHVHGQAFDQELQQQMKLERMQARAEQEQKRLKAALDAEKAQEVRANMLAAIKDGVLEFDDEEQDKKESATKSKRKDAAESQKVKKEIKDPDESAKKKGKGVEPIKAKSGSSKADAKDSTGEKKAKTQVEKSKGKADAAGTPKKVKSKSKADTSAKDVRRVKEEEEIDDATKTRGTKRKTRARSSSS